MRFLRHSIPGIILLTGLSFSWWIVASAAPNTVDSSGSNVILSVPGCNFDAICEPGNGETVANCPSDCTVTIPPDNGTQGGGGGGGSSGGSGYIEPFTFDNLRVVTDKNKAVITWTTRFPTLSVVSWGKSLEYEKGSLAEGQYIHDHSITITGLTPGTVYYFTIAARSAAGYRATYTNSFLTRTIPDTIPPGNVLAFKAYPYKGGIGLEWKNPTDADFSGVRIVRNQYRYPRDPRDGKVIYESNGNFFLDTDVVTNLYYNYAAFARDAAGNYSSGALARAIIYKVPPGNPIDTTGGAQFPDIDVEHPLAATSTLRLSRSDFDFIQLGKPISFVGDRILVVGSEKLTILGETLPSSIEYIRIQLNQPGGQYAYGFTKNKAGEWLTVIPENMISTTTPFSIIAETRTARAVVDGVFVPTKPITERSNASFYLILWYVTLGLLLILILILIWLLWIVAKNRKKEEEQPLTRI